MCTFTVSVTIPTDQAPGNYLNTTMEPTATVGGSTRTGKPASDTLVVVAPPTLTKEFTDDPVNPGGTVTLEFKLTNEDITNAASAVAFTDNLGATLSGLTLTSELENTCAGTVSGLGTDMLGYSGGSLAAGASCTIRLSLTVPGAASLGSFTNTTSAITAAIAGVAATGNAATDDLMVGIFTFTKEFVPDTVIAGTSLILRFTLDNNTGSSFSGISFIDDVGDFFGLDDELVVGMLPATPCGAMSSLVLAGDVLTLSGGEVANGGMCFFDIPVTVPVGTADGNYINSTTNLTASSPSVTLSQATDQLTVDSNQIELAKSFTNDPVAPGGTVNLQFTVTNLNASDALSALAFTDNLEAALSGLTITSVGTNTCGFTVGGVGTGMLTLTGGGIGAGGTCMLNLTLTLPGTVPGSSFPNTTSSATGMINTLSVTGAPASDTLLVNTLTFTKSFGGDLISGGTQTLSFTITNLDTSSGVADLAFTDNLDAAVSGLTATGALPSNPCGIGSTLTGALLLTLSGGNLTASGSCTFQVTVTVPSDTVAGSLTNTSSDLREAGSPTAPPAVAGLTVITEADLGITKADSPDPVIAGANLTYTINVTNNGPSDAQSVVVTDTLPAGVTLVSTSGCTEDPAAVPTCSLGPIAAGGSAAYTITVAVPRSTTGTLSNMASVSSATTDGNPGNESTSEMTTVSASADLSISKTDSVTSAVPGQTTLTYTISVANAGPSDALSVVSSDTLPAGLTLVSTSGCSEDPNGVPTCSLGTIAAGAMTQYTIVASVNADATGTLSNTASVSSSAPDPNAANNSATDSDTVLNLEADLAVTKTDAVTSAVPGQSLTYTIVATNNGPSADPSVSLTDVFPTDLSCTFTSAAAGGATGNSAVGSGNLSETLNMPPASSVTYTVACDIDSSATGTLSNTATVGSSVTDPAAANNSATDSDTVLDLEADLAVTKDDGGASVMPGSNITYTLTITNNGPSGSTGGTVSDILPPGLTFVLSASGCTEAAGTVTCPVPALANAASTMLTFVVTVGSGQTSPINNTATVAANETDPTSGNNSATEVSSLLPLFSKNFAPNPIAHASVSTLTFNIDNTGGAVAATSLDFSDNLPSGVAVATPPGASTTCTGGTLTAVAGTAVITYTGGTVGAGMTCTVTVDVTSAKTGTFVNTSGDLISSLGNSGPASDTLNVVDGVIAFAKSFVSYSGPPATEVSPNAQIDLKQSMGPVVLPGGMVEIQYTITNNSAVFPLTAIAFTDDLNAVIAGLTAVGLPGSDVCGVGSQISGTTTLTFSNGNLAPMASCIFNVTLQAPANAPVGSFTSTTSPITGLAGGAPVNQNPATAGFQVAFLDFSKDFPTMAVPGGRTTLEFIITNPDPANGATAIFFSDDLNAVLTDLAAVDLPATNVCGTGSQLTGTSLITLTGGNLGPGESCAFVVTLQIPPGAPEGTFTNVTSALGATVQGMPVTGNPADAAQAMLIVDIQPIPMLNGWGLILLGGLLALLARRRLSLG